MTFSRYVSLCALTLLLNGCDSTPIINEAAANQFQSLSKNQQAAYWQAIRQQNAIAELQQLGISVFTKGQEYTLDIPASLLFIDSTPMTAVKAQDTYQKIVKLTNIESTSRLSIETYSDTGDRQRDFALTLSWAQTVQSNLRDAGSSTAIINAVGKGSCQPNLTNKSPNAHIEIHYRIQQID